MYLSVELHLDENNVLITITSTNKDNRVEKGETPIEFQRII